MFSGTIGRGEDRVANGDGSRKKRNASGDNLETPVGGGASKNSENLTSRELASRIIRAQANHGPKVGEAAAAEPGEATTSPSQEKGSQRRTTKLESS